MTCPKCGSEAGWNGPTFERDQIYLKYPSGWGGGDEWLVYSCVTCSYKRNERTKDYVKPEVEWTVLKSTPSQIAKPWWKRLLWFTA